MRGGERPGSGRISWGPAALPTASWTSMSPPSPASQEGREQAATALRPSTPACPGPAMAHCPLWVFSQCQIGGSPSFGPPVLVVAESEKGPIPGLACGAYLDEAVVTCLLSWLGQVQEAALSTSLKGPPPASLAPSRLCSQALAELSSTEVTPGTEPGDTGGWGRGARADSGPGPCADPLGHQARSSSSPVLSLSPSSHPPSRRSACRPEV